MKKALDLTLVETEFDNTMTKFYFENRANRSTPSMKLKSFKMLLNENFTV